MERAGTTANSGGRNTRVRGIEERKLKAQGFAAKIVCGQWKMLEQKCKKLEKPQMPSPAASLRYGCLSRDVRGCVQIVISDAGLVAS